MKITIMGGGCAKCKQLLQLVKLAVKNQNIEANIEYVTDFEKIAKAGLMTTPGLLVDGKLVSAGKVPSLEEIERLIIKENN